jgi:hypothetical protein
MQGLQERKDKNKANNADAGESDEQVATMLGLAQVQSDRRPTPFFLLWTYRVDGRMLFPCLDGQDAVMPPFANLKEPGSPQ